MSPLWSAHCFIFCDVGEGSSLCAQTQESLRAMKLHIVNYQLKILLLSGRKPVENSVAPRENDREDEI